MKASREWLEEYSDIDVDTINEVIRRAKQEAAADQVEKPNEEQ